MSARKLAFVATDNAEAQAALGELSAAYGNSDPEEAEVIVALGGDGFMIETLHRFMGLSVPIYGMNRGSVGFLMNVYETDGLPERISSAEESLLNPLHMCATDTEGHVVDALAINEVSLLRQTRYAAHLAVSVDGRTRLEELVCDGVMVATPAGSTAYNLSAHGPILPLGSRLLALTPICAFRPRRWRGALLPEAATVVVDILRADHRSVSATADFTEVRNVVRVEVRQDTDRQLRLLFDQEHNLEERILREQFVP